MPFDPVALAEALMNALMNVIPRLSETVLNAMAEVILRMGNATWGDISSALLSSDMNFLTRTPPALSYNLGAVADLYRQWEPAMIGIVALSCVLAAIAVLGRTYFGWTWDAGEWSARIFLAMLLGLATPRIYITTIDLHNRISDAIVAAPISDAPIGSIDPISQAFLIIIWVVLGFRLLWRMAYRLVYFDILLVVGPIAFMCWALPGGEVYAKFWTRAFTGLLLGQLLVAICLRLAAQLSVSFGASWGAVALGVGVLLLSYDMATLFADIKNGGGVGGIFRSTARVVARFT